MYNTVKENINKQSVQGGFVNLELENLHVLIPGGTGAIGQAAAQAFLHEGSRVTVMGRSTGCLSEGDHFQVLKCDAEKDDLESVIDFSAKRFGGVDVLVNCMGIGEMYPIEHMPLESWERIIRINLTSAFRISKKVFSMMKERANGVIINIASFAGKRGTLFGSNTSYSASKGGMLALTNALAIEGAPWNVRVLSVSPGVVNTPMIASHAERMNDIISMIPLGRLGEPSDIAFLCVFLASKRCGYMTGENVNINGGLYMDF